ncbi:MAG TPA: SDR family oxidoreductase [Myxococcaceae bacterium]|jgi:NAD(P)-dependent dehydrogenase (short-subunit alcohol dehydrogenase family)
MKPLEGQVALVAGATRGAGRAIAMSLGEAGATVYCTGRSVRGRPATGTRPETIEETAELVGKRGGRGIAVRVDHTVESEVVALCEQIRREQGRLDVLVNDVWGGDELTEFGQPFWKLAQDKGRMLMERGIFSHILTSRYAVPLMLERKRGLIVEVTDGDTFAYRGNLFYDLVKNAVIRLAFAMNWELKRRSNITALAVTPGFLRSEAMLEHFGVTEANWRDAVARDRHFIASETPFYVGRAVAALAADPNVASKSGRVFSSWELAKEYGFKDEDGRQPDWGRYFQETFGQPYPRADEAAYASWNHGLMEVAYPDWLKE